MSIIKKLVKAINEGDSNGTKEIMHDDFKFLCMHLEKHYLKMMQLNGLE